MPTGIEPPTREIARGPAGGPSAAAELALWQLLPSPGDGGKTGGAIIAVAADRFARKPDQLLECIERAATSDTLLIALTITRDTFSRVGGLDLGVSIDLVAARLCGDSQLPCSSPCAAPLVPQIAVLRTIWARELLQTVAVLPHVLNALVAPAQDHADFLNTYKSHSTCGSRRASLRAPRPLHGSPLESHPLVACRPAPAGHVDTAIYSDADRAGPGKAGYSGGMAEPAESVAGSVCL